MKWLIRKIKRIVQWLWYWIFDPRGLKPSEIRKTVDKGFMETKHAYTEATFTVTERSVDARDKLRQRIKGKGRRIFQKKKK